MTPCRRAGTLKFRLAYERRSIRYAVRAWLDVYLDAGSRTQKDIQLCELVGNRELTIWSSPPSMSLVLMADFLLAPSQLKRILVLYRNAPLQSQFAGQTGHAFVGCGLFASSEMSRG